MLIKTIKTKTKSGGVEQSGLKLSINDICIAGILFPEPFTCLILKSTFCSVQVCSLPVCMCVCVRVCVCLVEISKSTVVKDQTRAVCSSSCSPEHKMQRYLQHIFSITCTHTHTHTCITTDERATHRTTASQSDDLTRANTPMRVRRKKQLMHPHIQCQPSLAWLPYHPLVCQMDLGIWATPTCRQTISGLVDGRQTWPSLLSKHLRRAWSARDLAGSMCLASALWDRNSRVAWHFLLFFVQCEKLHEAVLNVTNFSKLS